MKVCYQATKIIDKTALIEFLKKEVAKNRDIQVEVREVNAVINFCISKKDLLKKVDELYPNVFEFVESSQAKGIVLFSN